MPVESDDITLNETTSMTSLKTTKTAIRPATDSLLNFGDLKFQLRPEDQKFKIDRRLQCWYKWLNERKKQSDKFGHILKRTPGYLVMNSAEEWRGIVEDKMVFDYTKILAPPDHFRGSPAFFTIPFRLWDGECQAQLNEFERCEVPEIEYVAVPKTIQACEKNAYGGSHKAKLKYLGGDYRKRRANELAKKIKYVQPYKPDIDDLLIVGSGVQELILESVPIQSPVLTVAKPFENFDDTNVPDDNQRMSIGSLQLIVNDFILETSESTESKHKSVDINVIFECFLPPIKIRKKIVKIENRGTAAVHYFWRRITHSDNRLPIRSEKEIFYFDKRPTLILPGQSSVFKFMVRPIQEGSFRETWEMHTIPKLTHSLSQIKFNLVCNVFERNHKENYQEIKNRISDKTKTSTISSIVNYLLHCSLLFHSKHPIIYYGDVTKEELFYISNMDPLTHQPKYQYKEKLVQQLNDIYEQEITQDAIICNTWDYRVDSIIQIANMKKNISERTQLLNQINAILTKMIYSPNCEINPEFKKRQLVYNILLWAVNAIVDTAVDLETKCNIHRTRIQQNPEFELSIQRINLYSEPILYKLKTDPPIECFKRSDHRDAFRDKYRPPLLFESRDTITEDLTPELRHAYLSELHQHALNSELKKSLNVEELHSHPTKAILVEIDEEPVHAQPTQPIQPTKPNELSSSNLVLYNEVLYLRVYTILSKAVDDATAIIDACNLSANVFSMRALERMLDSEISATRLMSVAPPEVPTSIPPSWKSEGDQGPYMHHRNKSETVNVCDFGVNTMGSRRDNVIYLRDEELKKQEGPPKFIDRKVPK